MALGVIVADTDICIDFLRGADPGASAVERWLRDGRLRMTAVTAFELRLGADLIHRSAEIAALLQRRTIPLDVHAALAAGRAAVDLRERGRPIGVGDTLVAGVCLSRELPLATRNVRHFGQVTGLQLQALDPD